MPFPCSQEECGVQNTCFGVKSLNIALPTSLDSKKGKYERDNYEGTSHKNTEIVSHVSVNIVFSLSIAIPCHGFRIYI